MKATLLSCGVFLSVMGLGGRSQAQSQLPPPEGAA